MQNTVVPSADWAAELVDYQSWLRSSGLPNSTVKMRDYQLRRFGVSVGKAPYEVDLNTLIDYLARPQWGASTIRAHRGSLRSFYSWASISGRITVNPAEHLPPVASPIGKPRPANETAIDEALATAPARVALMIKLGSRLGLRCCEIAAVDTRELGRGSSGWTLRVLGKGNKTRMIPVSDKLAGELLEANQAGYVFEGKIDGHLSAGYVSKLVSKALPDGVTAHPLRHRFASRAFRGSRNIRAVQELLGHSSVATTQIYTAVDDDDLRDAAAAAA